MTTRVWLMRHAETSAPKVFHGFESDIGLSDLGRRQADTLADVLAEIRPEVIVSSGMLRARLTAQPSVERLGVPWEIEPELHERKVGILVGMPSKNDHGIWPDTLRRWMNGEVEYASEGAESFAQIRDRVVVAFERVTTKHQGKRIAIVAHGIVCKVLLLSILPGKQPSDWLDLGPIRNLATSILERRAEGWHAEQLNLVPPAIATLSGDHPV